MLAHLHVLCVTLSLTQTRCLLEISCMPIFLFNLMPSVWTVFSILYFLYSLVYFVDTCTYFILYAYDNVLKSKIYIVPAVVHYLMSNYKAVANVVSKRLPNVFF